jgi:hypothetical protein
MENGIMAFSNLGQWVLLAPGGAISWIYDRGGNQGTQFATADIKGANSTPHVAFDQWKRMDPGGAVRYGVTIKNVGTLAAFHNLEGGGVV